MTTKFLSTTLSHFGLDERQQKVYLALLELGLDSVQNIAKKAGVERTGIYGILQNLIKLGLVSETRRGKKRAFIAEDPKRLVEILEQKKLAIQSVIPDLQSLWNIPEVRPKIRFYEGIEGMRTVLADTLTAKGRQLLAILSVTDLFAIVGESWMENLVKERIANKISLRVIRSQPKEIGKEHWLTDPQALRELRYTPKKMVFTMSQYVYDNKVILLSSKQEDFGMIIESAEFAQSQRYLFEALWQISRLNQLTA